MFCYQCEQASSGTGCELIGICGKSPEVAALQDLLTYAAEGISMWAKRARALGVATRSSNIFVMEALFTTVTNVAFDEAALESMLQRAALVKEEVRGAYLSACVAQGKKPETLTGPTAWMPADTLEGLLEQAEAASVQSRNAPLSEEVQGARELILYGLRGLAAYADHAYILGVEDDSVFAFIHSTLDSLTRTNHSVDELLGLALKVGEVNLQVMGMLDGANTGAYGHPVPTPVRVTSVKGKAILISGHDLKDLEELLKQTAGTGINIYTHGEMLPAHGYPELKKYPHLVGNYGSAWQNQFKEFAAFPGAILMTTNCIQEPHPSYQGRLFTSGLVNFPDVQHIADRNFQPVIAAAQAAEGFLADEPEKTILVGFGHNAVLSVADKVIDAVKKGEIRHFFLIGGCDGAKPGRNYYTQFAEKTPADTMILTLACGKYRFNKQDFGTVAGLPRLLDVGQCNDAYSAIQIAVALAQAFNTDVNSLPLSLVLSWYEQKAVVILLTLLHLNIRNIRLGPSMPAFVHPTIYKVLKEKFNLLPITTPDADLQAILGKVAQN
jgi:hydroxylamine reductase